MRVKHDAEVDAVYVRFADGAVVESEEVRPGVVLDFDADGKLVALEILNASERLSGGVDFGSLVAA